ncbi:hypothetical protein CEQ90_06705 [Lewinellaceae bacterium SD302]|nr:hypothetical protein CEQ90_06705 [Lewinellaceae bacterium SD302]
MGSFYWLQSSNVSWLSRMLTGRRRTPTWLIFLLPFSMASNPDSTIFRPEFTTDDSKRPQQRFPERS